ncbi:MAG: hypothetical protein R2932_05295 [Caldilineaceae bacterium]
MISATGEIVTMDVPTTITRAAVAQYEALRRMGTINMFHYEGIQRETILYRMHALRTLNQSDYYFIFRNSEQLLRHFGLTEITDPAVLREIA